ncbi:MAG: DNA ligase D [Bacteriovorax sp.]
MKSKTKKKVRPTKWPGFIRPQLAQMVDSPPKEESYVHEIKFDGYRLQPHLKKSSIQLFTRSGLDWSDRFPGLVHSLRDLEVKSAIFDGEAVVLDREGKSQFGLLQQALSSGDDQKILIYLFDLLYLNGKDLRDLPLKERKKLLREIVPSRHPTIRYSDDIDQDAESFFKLTCKHHLEGIVSKDSTAPYSSGRSKLWCKCRCSNRQELVIGGYTTGKGSRGAELGALLLGVYDKNKFRYVGKVGTGFNRQSLRELKEKVEKLERATSAFDVRSPVGKEIHWLRPKLVAEVKFTEWTSDKSLRHPVFVGLREDKNIKEVVFEKASHIKVASRKSKAKDLKEEGEQEGERVELTHPNKILFPKEKITKQQIADYYERTAEFMLPFLLDRPLSLRRCPNGATKKCFFHKHLDQKILSKNNFSSFKVKEKNKYNTYVSLNTPLGLRHLAQMNAFEIHAWNCRHQSLMNPDQIVMDFDPDLNVKFTEVVKASLELKKILDKLKLKSFVKLSGGKGVHVHVPIAPIYTWDEIRAFSKALADLMVSRCPKLYISTMSKEKREGKIFLDYFRNTFGATTVAPYSLRARPMSAVALPVEWSELLKIKSADQFTLSKALLKIKKRKSDPWKKMFSLKQEIKLLTSLES